MVMTPELSFSEIMRGETCLDVYRLEYWNDGRCSSPCIAVFLEVRVESWVRFFFDAGVFFWNVVREVGAELSEGQYFYRSVRAEDAQSLVGKTIERCVFDGSPDGKRALSLDFTGGGRLRLSNADDETPLVIFGDPAPLKSARTGAEH